MNNAVKLSGQKVAGFGKRMAKTCVTEGWQDRAWVGFWMFISGACYGILAYRLLKERIDTK